MFETIEQGLEIYRVEVGKYAEVALSLHALEEDPKTGQLVYVDNRAKFDELSSMQERMEAMSEVLGLTQDEIKAIFIEFDLDHE